MQFDCVPPDVFRRGMGHINSRIGWLHVTKSYLAYVDAVYSQNIELLSTSFSLFNWIGVALDIYWAKE